ncbi:unnamed protein product [Thelazia callipaeda]|uniref:Lipoyl-binding domain-containing protein n=1 Tax=Thelazia callipaeda TaxID=103827 RepID=A0A0N5D9Q7_THECL|nr:unnamed protein product [Thelazia callipaeda]
MSKLSIRNFALPLRYIRSSLQFATLRRTAVSAASTRGISSSRLTSLFGISSHYISRLHLLNGSRKELYRMYSSGLPEHKLIPMPALSPTMEHGTIVKWHKAEGDEVSEGDLVCEIETDKSVMAFEASDEGYLAKILTPDGTKGIQIGKPICVFVENKEDCDAFSNFKVEGKHF